MSSDSAWPDTITIEESSEPTLGVDELRAVQGLVDLFEGAQLPSGPRDERWFGWIPVRLELFFQGMATARAELGLGRHRFLEVGCGLGTKLALAHELGFEAVGIDIHRPYLEVCWRTFPHVAASQCSMADFQNWGEFDLVYVARPVTSVAAQMIASHRILEGMRPGALL